MVETGGGSYRVLTPGGDVEATLRGKLKQGSQRAALVVVGDLVGVRPAAEGRFVIDEVRDRKTVLARRMQGGHATKIVAANLDRLLVVASVAQPSPSTTVIDRMIVMGEAGGLKVVLVLTKTDLPGGGEQAATLARFYERAGYPSVCVSVVTGDGVADFERVVGSGLSALAGPSGVGKSSLLNRLDPSLGLRTSGVGRRSLRGKHTTVASRLVSLPGGGRVADTPGFSDVSGVRVDPEDLDACFADFRPYLGQCRFRDCRHLREPGCAVLEAVAEGRVAAQRHRSYRMILDEM